MRPPLPWMGVRVATIDVVSHMTRHESAGCGMRVVPRHSDRSTGGRPVQHGMGVLLRQISWCRPSKQYRPDSTVFYRAMLSIRGTSHRPVSVCLSVRLSQVGVLLKRLNVGSHKQHRTIAQGPWYSDANDLREIRPESPPTRATNAGRVGQNRRLSTNNRQYLENRKR